MKFLSKINLIKALKPVAKNGWTDSQLRTLVDSLWRSSSDLEALLDARLPRSNTTQLTPGNNIIEFENEFPEETEYILRCYTYSGNYQTGHTIIGTPDETGFTINVKKACSLDYYAIPKY